MHNGPRKPGGRGPAEQAKDFKTAIKRLFKELKSFYFLIILSLVLAALGSILSILSPDKLSDLTDKISEGLVINKENMTTLFEQIGKNLSNENLEKELPAILEIDLSKKTIGKILENKDIKDEEKIEFQKFLNNIEKDNKVFLSLNTLSDSILTIILPNSFYKNIEISTNDKISFIKSLSPHGEEKTFTKLPESIGTVLLSDIKVDGINITVEDQIKMINQMGNMSEGIQTSEFYKKIEEMPESIQKVLEPFMDIDAIKNITLFLVGLYVCSALFTYIESIAMTVVTNRFAQKLRKSISLKINKLPLKYFDGHETGDILSRVTNDVDMVAQSMDSCLSSLVSAVTLFIGSIIMMFYTNWIMALTAIFSSLFGFIFMFIILGKSQKYFVTRQEELGNLNGHIEEIYSGLNVVKAYNGKNQSDIEFDKYNQNVYDAGRMSRFLSGMMHPMMHFIGNFGYVAVCIVGALLAMNGYISFGVIVAFITYVRLFTSPLSQIGQAMTSMQSTAAASERVFEFLDEEEMSNQEDLVTVLDKDKVKGKIEFKNVMFKYDGNDKPTINNFTATALPGQKIAIVGPTGAGKTTMVNLLMKFYDINSGEILIDGISTKKLTRENIHSLFTMVLQDTWVFEGTVKDNIIYSRENVTDESVKEVCKIVGLDHFIKSLPNGYDSLLTDNESVSAGQRQLLTIARGMIEDAPFLILDEATSNVDTRTEELVQMAMDKLTEGRTSFIIAHRLSTIKNADLILVMKDGNIIEQGNHEELMNKNGFYAELYNSQFEL